MAKQRHQAPDTTSSRGAMLAIAVLGVLVAGLLVWALTRTVEPASPEVATATTEPASTTAATGTSLPPAQTPFPPATATSSPIASTTAPITALPTTQPPAAQPAESDTAAVKRIAAEDVREKMKGGNVVLVDVRDANSFATSHIAGSVHIPMASLQANLDRLPKDKEIITYCT